jgi:BolA protein
LIAPEFTSLSRVARHRLVYDALQKHIPTEIHALAIVALTPEEAI